MIPYVNGSTCLCDVQVSSPAASPVSKDPVGANKASVESLLRSFQKDATDLCFRQQDMRRRQAKLAAEKEALVKQQVGRLVTHNLHTITA